jgi:DsbC/DsbD-like thiol-disulfide interchange protein
MGLASWLSLRARVEPERLATGGRGRLIVEVGIPEGCHIESHQPSEPFLIPTELLVEPPEGMTVGAVVYPPDEERTFEWSPAVLRVYRGTVAFTAPIQVHTDARPGARPLSGRVRYQGCTEATCLPPAEQEFDAALDVVD